ncbi:MAG: CoA transferase [Pseudomonadales bacterium]|nr:CoA transferase [Pseudomonadales bacterium]
MSKDQTQALSGITVLSFEHAIAAPLCSRQLADLGARVIKIERPDGGDFARHYDQRAKGQSSHFIWTNRGKQSLSLNFKATGAREILRRLLERSDVLLQNLAPGAIERLGLSWQALQADYPRLIHCSISGYGQTGPLAGRKAYDLLIQAESGFLSVTGNQAGPAKAGISIADIAAGSQAHSAILAALIKRQHSGRGSEISISMLEAMVEWMGFPLYYAWDGQQPPEPLGTDHASIYPYGSFCCQDGQQLIIGIQNEREWQSFCSQVLEAPELAENPDYANNPARSSNRQPLKARIDQVLSSLDSETVANRLDQANIAWARVNDLKSVWNHPQLQALNRFTEIQTPNGPIQSFLPPGQAALPNAARQVPALGQHNEPLLQELGYSPQEISQLKESGCI